MICIFLQIFLQTLKIFIIVSKNYGYILQLIEIIYELCIFLLKSGIILEYIQLKVRRTNIAINLNLFFKLEFNFNFFF